MVGERGFEPPTRGPYRAPLLRVIGCEPLVPNQVPLKEATIPTLRQSIENKNILDEPPLEPLYFHG